MATPSQPANRDPNEKWARTRRNVMAMGGVLSSSLLLADCKADHKNREPSCYLKGTRILTSSGERKVEQLSVGEAVRTIDGNLAPILWIGRYAARLGLGRRVEKETLPIRIAQGALGTGLPHADLFVSADHRLFLDGVLIRAADLRNGTSVNDPPSYPVGHIEYFHLLLRKHNIIFAEGVGCETLLPTKNAVMLFDNADEFISRFEPLDCVPERPCAPVYADLGGRAQFWSHFRNALSPWIDLRNQIDRMRDRLLLERLEREAVS
jgi:hypothetical protein